MGIEKVRQVGIPGLVPREQPPPGEQWLSPDRPSPLTRMSEAWKAKPRQEKFMDVLELGAWSVPGFLEGAGAKALPEVVGAGPEKPTNLFPRLRQKLGSNKTIADMLRMDAQEGMNTKKLKEAIDTYITNRGRGELMQMFGESTPTGSRPWAEIPREDILERYAPLRERLHKAADYGPEQLAENLRKLEGFPDTRMAEGYYQKATDAITKPWGGNVYLNYAALDPAATFAHEAHGHGVFDMVHNYAQTHMQGSALEKVLNVTSDIHRKAYGIRDIAREAAARIQNFAGKMSEETFLEKYPQLKDAYDELADLSLKAHRASPEERFANWQKADVLNNLDNPKFLEHTKKNLMDIYHKRQPIYDKLNKLEQRVRSVAHEVESEIGPRQIGEFKPNVKVAQDFTRRTTGMPHYDNILHNPDYMRKNKGLIGTVIEMSPDEYIERVAKGFKSTPEEQVKWTAPNTVKKYAEAHKKGDKFPMPVLDYARKSFGQEGRHRALSAIHAGIQKIPVLVVKDAPDVVKGAISNKLTPAAREAMESQLLSMGAKLPSDAQKLLQNIVQHSTDTELESYFKRILGRKK